MHWSDMLEDLRDSLFKVEELPGGESRIDTSRFSAEAWPVVPHFHEQYEVVVYHDISCLCTINGEEVHLGKGQAVFFPPFTMHSFDVGAGRSEYTVIQFSRSVADELFGAEWDAEDAFVCTYSEEQFAQITDLIKVYDTLDKSSRVAQNLAHTIIYWIFDMSKETGERAGGKSRFQKLLKHLHDNKRYSLNAEDAAEICGVSRPYFMNSFKKQFQITYNDFLVRRKIAYAKNLLLNTDRKSADIAEELGFEDPSYFVKVFKKVTGITPKKFRSQHKEVVI